MLTDIITQPSLNGSDMKMAIIASNLPAAKDDLSVQLKFREKGKVLSFKPGPMKGNEAIILNISPSQINITEDTEVEVKVVMSRTGVESEPKSAILYSARNNYQPPPDVEEHLCDELNPPNDVLTKNTGNGEEDLYLPIQPNASDSQIMFVPLDNNQACILGKHCVSAYLLVMNYFPVATKVVDKATDTSEDTSEVMPTEEFQLPFENQDELHGDLNSVKYCQRESLLKEKNNASINPCNIGKN